MRPPADDTGEAREVVTEELSTTSMSDLDMNSGTEESLRESQARLAGIVNSAVDTIITVDSEPLILVFNHPAERVCHCAAAAVIRQSLDCFIPESCRPAPMRPTR